MKVPILKTSGKYPDLAWKGLPIAASLSQQWPCSSFVWARWSELYSLEWHLDHCVHFILKDTLKRVWVPAHKELVKWRPIQNARLQNIPDSSKSRGIEEKKQLKQKLAIKYQKTSWRDFVLFHQVKVLGVKENSHFNRLVDNDYVANLKLMENLIDLHCWLSTKYAIDCHSSIPKWDHKIKVRKRWQGNSSKKLQRWNENHLTPSSSNCGWFTIGRSVESKMLAMMFMFPAKAPSGWNWSIQFNNSSVSANPPHAERLSKINSQCNIDERRKIET